MIFYFIVSINQHPQLDIDKPASQSLFAGRHAQSDFVLFLFEDELVNRFLPLVYRLAPPVRSHFVALR